MFRFMGAVAAGLVLASGGVVLAADATPPAGSWKMTLPFQGATWLVKLESADGKWSGTAAAAEKVPEGKVQNVAVADGVLKFDLRLEQPGVTLPFEGALPKDKDGTAIRGSVVLNGKAYPAELEKTTLSSFDPYEVLKDDLVRQAGKAEGVGTALELLGGAEEKKASADEVRSWAEKAAKWSEPYGSRYHREVLLTVAETLAEQKAAAAVALDYARQAEKLTDPKKDSAGTQRRVLRALAAALKASDKKDEAKEIEQRL
ncbi:MAG TPA: hypothetical protein VMS17_13455, partial [Gemmataceae bacterium]|nr:hypothetical protein [Gemmataceae bacterium]